MIRQQEIDWREIPGYNGLYLLSNLGNIFNTKKRKFLTPVRQKNSWSAHLCINGNPKHVSIHQLIKQIYGNT